MPTSDFDATREAGRQAALEAIRKRAPKDPLQRVAWTIGYGEVDETLAAVVAAKDQGHTWREIADAAGLPLRTAISRFDRARKRSES